MITIFTNKSLFITILFSIILISLTTPISSTTVFAYRSVYINYTPFINDSDGYTSGFHTIKNTYSSTNITPLVSTSLYGSSTWRTSKIYSQGTNNGNIVNYNNVSSYSRYQKFLMNNIGSSSHNYAVVWTTDSSSNTKAVCNSTETLTIEFRVRFFNCLDDANNLYSDLSNLPSTVIQLSNNNIVSENYGYEDSDDGNYNLNFSNSADNLGKIFLGNSTTIQSICPNP